MASYLSRALICAVMMVSPAMGGTVLWLTADEGEPGAPAVAPVDSGDNSLTVTGTGGVTYSSDVAGIGAASSPHERSFSFNGVNGLIRVADHAALNLAGNYTIEFFMKLTGEYTLGATWQLFERQTSTQEYTMYADPAPYAEFVTYLDGSAGGGGFGGSGSLPTRGGWNHIALVYDSNNVDREANLYVNGVFVTGRNFVSGQGTNFSMIADLLFGGSEKYAGRWLEGLLDEIRISDKALDPSEFLNVAVPVAPEITNLDGVPLLVSVDSDVVFTASFSDEPGDTHVASWDFGDGTVLETNPAYSPVTAVHAYAEAGIYTVELTITDASGLSDTETIVVVAYDPTAGFTTGGGWFIPDSESFIDGEPVTDTVSKANFGFMVKYKKGADTPDGNLEFMYKAGDINLHSTGTDWLVIQSATKVRFKGEATVNGEGPYTFRVTAEDNGELGTSDTFKIEIWLGVVDTENGPPEPKHTAQGVLGGGDIKIHQ
jgi:hypothetical protein